MKSKWVMLGLIWSMIGVAFGSLVSGCDSRSTQKRIESEYETVVIDDCEYIVVITTVRGGRVRSITHKGNCNNPHHLDNVDRPAR